MVFDVASYASNIKVVDCDYDHHSARSPLPAKLSLRIPREMILEYVVRTGLGGNSFPDPGNFWMGTNFLDVCQNFSHSDFHGEDIDEIAAHLKGVYVFNIKI